MSAIQPQGVPVRDLINLPELRSVRLVAGHRGLHRIVDDVVILESPSDAPSLSANKLIVANADLPGSVSAPHATVLRQLSHHCGGAFALHPGTTEANVAPAALELADELAVPFLVLPGDMTYARLLQIVLHEILNQQVSIIRRTDEATRLITDLTVGGADVGTVVSEMAKLLDRPLALFTRQGVPLAAECRGRTHILGQLLDRAPTTRSFRDAKRMASSPGSSGLVAVDERIDIDGAGPLTQVVVPLPTRDKPDALFVVWVDKRPIGEWELRALQHTSAAIAVARVARRTVGSVGAGAEQEIVQRLCNSHDLDEVILTRQAAHHGIDLNGINYVHVVQHGGTLSDPAAASGDPATASGDPTATIDSPLLDTVRRVIKTHCTHALIGSSFNSVIAIVPSATYDVPGNDKLSAGRRDFQWHVRLAQNIIDALPTANDKQPVVGLSSPAAGVTSIAAAIMQTRQTACIGRKLFGSGRVYTERDLWYFRLLVQAHEENELDDTIMQLLGELLIEDEQSGGYLTETLDAFFDFQQSFTETAKHLFVHPNTVRYRIEKVKEFIGDEPFKDPMSRLSCHVALKAVRLLYRPPTNSAAQNVDDDEAALYPSVGLSVSHR